MSVEQVILGPILNPRAGGAVEFVPDGAIACDGAGLITYVGLARDLPPTLVSSRKSDGVICPPFLDAHVHIPQHPIRGRFLEGVTDVGKDDDEHGRLIAGLNRNVFPAEAKFADDAYAEQTIRQFVADTLAHGVIGGAAYSSVHRRATERALEVLPDTWSVGMCLMNRNCPAYLRTDEANVERDLTELAEQFGRRSILTDRFAVAVDPELRRRAVRVTARFDSMAQTHLDEQVQEKEYVEGKLHPDAGSYLNVYARDGLLDRFAILAHCVHTRDEEFDLVSRRGAAVAHCPTSNALLGSGIMPLDRVLARGIDYALCTDVAASPTTSLLAEMAQFLKVHAGGSARATPAEALYRTTLAPARMLGLGKRLGSFEVGKEFSFVEINAGPSLITSTDADHVIRLHLLGLSDQALSRYADGEMRPLLDRLARAELQMPADLHRLTQDANKTAQELDAKVRRVTLRGAVLFERQ